MTPDQILPCPFCGGALTVTDPCGKGQWMAVCDTVGCQARQAYFESRAEAIEAWNRRAEVSLPRAGVEQIRANLNDIIWAEERFYSEGKCVLPQELRPYADALRLIFASAREGIAALALLPSAPPSFEPGTSWPFDPPEETTSEPQPPCPMCGNPASAHTPRFDEGLGVEALVCPEKGS